MTTDEAARCVLLVEDDPDDARVVVHAMRMVPGVKLVHVRTGGEAMEFLQREDAWCCLVDQRLPDGNGVDVIKRIRDHGHEGQILMVSGVREDAIVGSAFEAGADDFIVKDLDYGDELIDRLGLQVV